MRSQSHRCGLLLAALLSQSDDISSVQTKHFARCQELQRCVGPLYFSRNPKVQRSSSPLQETASCQVQAVGGTACTNGMPVLGFIKPSALYQKGLRAAG